MASHRTLAMRTLKDVLKKLDSGRYTFVYRGAVDWASFDFQSHKFGASIFCPESRPETVTQGTRLTVDIDLFTDMGGEKDGFNEDVMEILHEDLIGIVKELQKAKTQEDDHVFTQVEHINSREAAFVDGTFKPHGVIHSLRLSF